MPSSDKIQQEKSEGRTLVKEIGEQFRPSSPIEKKNLYRSPNRKYMGPRRQEVTNSPYRRACHPEREMLTQNRFLHLEDWYGRTMFMLKQAGIGNMMSHTITPTMRDLDESPVKHKALKDQIIGVFPE